MHYHVLVYASCFLDDSETQVMTKCDRKCAKCALFLSRGHRKAYRRAQIVTTRFAPDARVCRFRFRMPPAWKMIMPSDAESPSAPGAA